MPKPDLANARTFILGNARLLERHLFSFQFESGSADAVMRALRAYRHDSGLFGFGLEPDKRATEPQPMDQATAMDILDTIGAAQSDFRSILDALDALTNADGGVPFSAPTVATAPHAPWWACEGPQPSSINPTGIILSYLWRNGLSHPWMAPAEAFCWRALDALEDAGPHSIQNAVAFLAAHPDRGRAETAVKKLRETVRSATCFDPNTEDYVFSPLNFAPSPASPAASFFTSEELEPHLQHMVDQQQEDGGWHINWPALSDGVRTECRGIVTLRNLNTLKAYGRLETS